MKFEAKTRRYFVVASAVRQQWHVLWQRGVCDAIRDMSMRGRGVEFPLDFLAEKEEKEFH